MKTKKIATILLIIITILYFILKYFEKQYPVLKIFVAFCEAGMVGALADWFAVVALFRHPLGIPIPHTAIIPRSKDKIGSALADFVKYNFLTKEVVLNKIAKINFTEKIINFIESPKFRIRLSIILNNFFKNLINNLDNDEIKEFLKSNINSGLKNIDFSKFIIEILNYIKKSNLLVDVIQNLAIYLQKLLGRKRNTILKYIERETPWWTFGLLDNKIFNTIMKKLSEFLNETINSTDSIVYKEANIALNKYLDYLKKSNEARKKVNLFVIKLKDDIFNSKILNKLFTDLKTNLINDIEEKKFDGLYINQLDKLSNILKNNSKLSNIINLKIRNFIVENILKYSENLVLVIKETISKWEFNEISQKLESKIGNDLQYIRINGTLIGGLIGIFIFLVNNLIY